MGNLEHVEAGRTDSLRLFVRLLAESPARTQSIPRWLVLTVSLTGIIRAS
jgi:hypothetical protein